MNPIDRIPLDIVLYPQVVNTPCKPVLLEDITGLALNVSNMIDFCKANKGIGLAAPQIGDYRTYFVMVLFPKPLVIINPVLTLPDGERVYKTVEGCFSIPGKRFAVKRFRKINVTWTDLLGQRQNTFMVGDYAIVFQHEFSHLGSLCICDTGKEVLR